MNPYKQGLTREQRMLLEDPYWMDDLDDVTAGAIRAALVSLDKAQEALEAGLDAALAEIRRQGGPDYLLVEAKNEGLRVAFMKMGLP
jgi:hypothetical protein